LLQAVVAEVVTKVVQVYQLVVVELEDLELLEELLLDVIQQDLALWWDQLVLFVR
jgi:hypothetical protein